MIRWLSILTLILISSIALTACGGGPAPVPTNAVVPPTLDNAPVVATSSVATSAPQMLSAAQALPTGTLILVQQGRPIAQTPERQTIALPGERFGPQAAPNGRYAVR